MALQPYSNAFVSAIAETLNAAGIPCVLWGHCLLQAHGVPTIIASVDFVVSDGRLRIAAKALLANFSLRPLSPSHLHIEDVSDIKVGLYPQSDTLWFLPPLDNSLIPGAQDDATPKVPPYLCLASDSTILPPWRPGRGNGVFQAGYHTVLIPRSHVLLEAFLRLYARDVGKRIGSFGMAMISYMEEYVDDDGLLDAELLPEPLKRLYKELRAGPITVRQWTRDLQEALGVPLDEFDDK